MPNPTEISTVTALQLIYFAGNVNDSRIIEETHELAASCGIDGARVVKIAWEPGVRPRTPKLVFTLYVLDDEGKRVAVMDDGSPYDPSAAGQPWHYVTTVQRVTFKGELPVWWEQAAKTQAPEPMGVS